MRLRSSQLERLVYRRCGIPLCRAVQIRTMQPSAICLCKGLPADDCGIVVGTDVGILHQDSLDGTVLHGYACIRRSRLHAQTGNIAVEDADYDSGFLFIDDSLAVYYAEGEIVQEEATTSLYSNEASIVGTTVIRELKELADNDDIKAVVLRVNSPGGSAYASEQIWHQVMNIKAKKPIIVSMGGYAASGGYYISCAANWIVAEPTTLTGSIGIFGMFPEASELINDKLALNFVTVKTHEFADFGDYSRPVTDNESAALQAYINKGYDLFTRRCAEGRGLSQDSIKVIGEGRVWTGEHAKKIGLVDQLGNLDDAIAVAKKKAKVGECTIKTYPEKASIFENLLQEVKPTSYADEQLKANLGEFYPMVKSIQNINNKDNIQAALPYFLKFNM